MTFAIKLDNVSKRYRIGKGSTGLRSLLSGWRQPAPEQHHWALRDVSISLQPGEGLGIIGPNGAGKTTLLKLLSKVTYPTEGKIAVNGRFSALIELGAGFHPDLSGRDNIYLNGIILGMKRTEIKKRFDQIVEFSGVAKFLDTPIKRYSSGMHARLGFAVAAHLDPDVLLVDEVLAVGDMAFQRKCYDRMLELIRGGTALMFVSHNMRAVQRVCAHSLVLYRGRPVFLGTTGEAIAQYSNLLREAAAEQNHYDALSGEGISQQVMTLRAVIERVEMVDANGEASLTFQSGQSVVVRVTMLFKEYAAAPIFACKVWQPDGQIVYDFTTHWAGITTPDFDAGATEVVEFGLQLHLAAGTYQMGINVAYSDLSRYYDRQDRVLDFVVLSDSGARGVADLEADFRVVPKDLPVIRTMSTTSLA